ncbi:hypothetical protein [Desulfopila aestuarii]|uniref:Uncharacterized protein n=1 Tax=Desulfopila aestuarii DSM 18488 TaxID=1121416 RepID=A0A1M7YFL4_9BACT|nr:hypothetical protein [Desulfopila aestuarii]SHO51403.1 hypothetical protein SAMN02745220_03988 [Desulfopila aestuarii DSM 18488]
MNDITISRDNTESVLTMLSSSGSAYNDQLGSLKTAVKTAQESCNSFEDSLDPSVDLSDEDIKVYEGAQLRLTLAQKRLEKFLQVFPDPASYARESADHKAVAKAVDKAVMLRLKEIHGQADELANELEKLKSRYTELLDMGSMLGHEVTACLVIGKAAREYLSPSERLRVVNTPSFGNVLTAAHFPRESAVISGGYWTGETAEGDLQLEITEKEEAFS